MRKQDGEGRDGNGGGGGGGGERRDPTTTGAHLAGLGVLALVGGAIIESPLLLGFGVALVVVGGATYLGGSRGSGASGCFVAGTVVSTGVGPAPIERVRAGDQVRAVDLREWQLGLAKVLETYRFVRVQFLELGFEDETIVCTPRHRFFRGGSWVAAADLKPGDRLCSGDGRLVELQTVLRKLRLRFVYNFAVEGPRNYLIGTSALLVHNLKIDESPPSDDSGDDDGDK